MIFTILFSAGAFTGVCGFAVAMKAQRSIGDQADRELWIAGRILAASCVLMGLALADLILEAIITGDAQ